MHTENMVAYLAKEAKQRLYGIYRGFVKDNADPENRGRLKVTVPSVLRKEVVWASPCLPYGGNADQGFLFIPDNGAGVWIQFEEGKHELPVWVGTFWSKPGGESELPKPNDAEGKEEGSVQDPPTRKIIKTKVGHTIQLEDADGDEMVTIVEAKNSHVITMNKDGIKITDGANKHEVSLDNNGISISDGVSSGNKIAMEQSGITVEDKNGNKVIMGPSGINVGSDSAADFFVLGTQFLTEVSNFLISLGTHTHVGNMGGPTSPPTAPMMLNVPLSAKHKVE